jgi:hypothetical protein
MSIHLTFEKGPLRSSYLVGRRGTIGPLLGSSGQIRKIFQVTNCLNRVTWDVQIWLADGKRRLMCSNRESGRAAKYAGCTGCRLHCTVELNNATVDNHFLAVFQIQFLNILNKTTSCQQKISKTSDIQAETLQNSVKD